MPREIWVLVAAAFLIAVGYGLIAPILPQFVVTFDVSIAAAGAVVSIFSVSRLIFAPSAGRLIDGFGARKVYLTGLITVAVTTGMIALVGAYWQILVLRAIAGLGSTMFTISAMGLIVRLAPPERRGRASALYGSAFLLGNVIGPVAGAGMSFLGMRWPFIIYGTGVLMAAFVVWWLMPNRKVDRIEQSHAAAKDAAPESAEPEKMHVREAIHDSAYRSALVSNFTHGWVNMGVRVATLPLFAAAVFNDGTAVAGFALAIYAAGNAVMLQVSGRLADTIGRKPLIIAGLIGSAIFTGGMGFADEVWSLLLFAVLAGASSGMLNPSQQAVLADVIGNNRSGGSVLSTYQMAMDFGQIVGPILVGVLADLYGFRVAFGVCAIVALVAVAFWSFGRETLPTARKRAVVERDGE